MHNSRTTAVVTAQALIPNRYPSKGVKEDTQRFCRKPAPGAEQMSPTRNRLRRNQRFGALEKARESAAFVTNRRGNRAHKPGTPSVSFRHGGTPTCLDRVWSGRRPSSDFDQAPGEERPDTRPGR